MSSTQIVVLAIVSLMVVAAANADDVKCSYNGQQYDIGTMFDGTDAFYYCKRDGSGTKNEAIGCINNGQRVYDLALYQKGDNYFRCRVGDTTVSADLWGCAVRMPDGTVQPKSIACTWDSSTTDPISYVNCCIQQGGTAVVSQLYCLYSYRGGRVQVNQNCYRIFDKTAAGCKRNADGNSLTMTTWNAPDADAAAKDPQASGMSQC